VYVRPANALKMSRARRVSSGRGARASRRRPLSRMLRSAGCRRTNASSNGTRSTGAFEKISSCLCAAASGGEKIISPLPRSTTAVTPPPASAVKAMPDRIWMEKSVAVTVRPRASNDWPSSDSRYSPSTDDSSSRRRMRQASASRSRIARHVAICPCVPRSTKVSSRISTRPPSTTLRSRSRTTALVRGPVMSGSKGVTAAPGAASARNRSAAPVRRASSSAITTRPIPSSCEAARAPARGAGSREAASSTGTQARGCTVFRRAAPPYRLPPRSAGAGRATGR